MFKALIKKSLNFVPHFMTKPKDTLATVSTVLELCWMLGHHGKLIVMHVLVRGEIVEHFKTLHECRRNEWTLIQRNIQNPYFKD